MSSYSSPCFMVVRAVYGCGTWVSAHLGLPAHVFDECLWWRSNNKTRRTSDKARQSNAALGLRQVSAWSACAMCPVRVTKLLWSDSPQLIHVSCGQSTYNSHQSLCHVISQFWLVKSIELFSLSSPSYMCDADAIYTLAAKSSS